MRCPYCGNDMEKGYIQSRDGIIWRKKNHAMPNATTDATGTSQNTDGMFIRSYV